ncbi:MAG: HEAT repeat domain-containing protein, partial [Deltaproteobacteria bacterium]|nr:HEAT repeat domain-containing protein [Deltaproteobacteria bacterium]
PDVAAPLQAALYEKGPNPEVKAYAMAGLYGQDPDRYRPVVEQWLNALDGATRKAGIIAAGLTRDQTFIPKLMALAEKEDNTPLLPFILKALQEQGAPDLDSNVCPWKTTRGSASPSACWAIPQNRCGPWPKKESRKLPIKISNSSWNPWCCRVGPFARGFSNCWNPST